MTGVCLIPIIPVRSKPSHKSEMVNQLIFGDIYDIIQIDNKWLQISSFGDSYKGWIDSEQSHNISNDEANILKKKQIYFSRSPFDAILCLDTMIRFHISIGSILYGNNTFEVGGKRFRFEGKVHEPEKRNQTKDIILRATDCVNSPYLWGGKTVMGFDCSGFVQVIFRMNCIQLPRDTSQQVLCGRSVLFSEAVESDLAFFGEEEKTTHVGIVAPNNTIIHSSGKVRIDELTEQGILHCTKKTITHNLTEIRRVLV